MNAFSSKLSFLFIYMYAFAKPGLFDCYNVVVYFEVRGVIMSIGLLFVAEKAFSIHSIADSLQS